MPLTVENNLPLINILFVSTQNHSEIIFASQIDSCAAMNVGNLKIHQWVITKHPEMVSRYIQCNDEKPFDTIALNCAVEGCENIKDAYG